MSDPLRIAAAVEGPTDVIVLEAILCALLPGVEFEFQTLQPEGSAAFGTRNSSSDRNRSRLRSLYLHTNRHGLPPSRRSPRISARLKSLDSSTRFA